MARRRIITMIATSADGYIARPDGNVDWLDRPRIKGDYGMGAFFRTVDTVLWGRKTFDEAQDRGGLDPFGRGMKHYIFTHRDHPAVDGATFVNGAIKPFARRLRRQTGKDIWMMGGGGVIASFLDAGEIDAFIISVIPIFIGEGIPLIAPRHRTVPLRLRSTKKFVDGVVRLHYEVG